MTDASSRSYDDRLKMNRPTSLFIGVLAATLVVIVVIMIAAGYGFDKASFISLAPPAVLGTAS